MKKTIRTFWLTALILSLTLILALTSCGSSGSALKESAIDEAYDGVTGANGSSNEKGELPSAEDYDRKVIRTATMDCETKDFDDATSFLISTLAECGGYTESSKITGTGYREGTNSGSARYATYVFRVPADALDAFLTALSARDGIRVVSQGSNAEEITGAYYDLTTRIDTLKAERDSLSKMLAGFTDYKDMNAMLQVQERLYDVIEEIESLQTQINLYDDKVAMSTVTLTLREVITYTQAAAPSFGERIGDAFTDSWKNFADGCQDFAVWFVEAIPTLLVLAVIAAVVIPLVIRAIGKAKAKKKAKQADGKSDKNDEK